MNLAYDNHFHEATEKLKMAIKLRNLFFKATNIISKNRREIEKKYDRIEFENNKRPHLK